jgi:hypothetical protein
MTLKLYAAAISFRKDDRICSVAVSVTAHSTEEAMGAALVFCRKKHPATDGYSQHQACVSEVPEHQLDAVRPRAPFASVEPLP